MRTHVFIVNNNTMPIHLRYLFAGTGARDEDENISLLSDIKRIRPGDFVLFYIEATTRVRGGFYGVFRIANQTPIVFHVRGAEGYEPNLPKKLIYRTLIEPYEVYSEGVPEWEALDKLPVYASEMQWSLIYRKLKGKRGCTPLLPWEGQRLIDMIRHKNAGRPIADYNSSFGFDWDSENRRIITSSNRQDYPHERQYNFDLLALMNELRRRKRAFEVHLQLYFTERIGCDPALEPIVGNNIIWFGNEVACGVGMQKIDILTICQDNLRKEYRLIELKYEPVEPEVVNQIEYYVSWASQNAGKHLDAAYEWNIQPIIVAPPNRPRIWKDVISAFKNYNEKKLSLPISYFEFEFADDNNIVFIKKGY